MPNVNPKESLNDYMSRCIPVVMKEGKTQDQAKGKCYGMYKQSKKKKEAKGDSSEPNFDKENNLGMFIYIPDSQ
jgi:hypothetical protein